MVHVERNPNKTVRLANVDKFGPEACFICKVSF